MQVHPAMNLPFAKTSLRLRLVAAISLVMVITLVVGLALTYVHACRKVDVEMTAAMVGGRAIVQREVEELDATPEPARDLPGLVRVFDGSRHIKARLVDGDGAVIYASTPDISDADISAVLLQALGGEARIFRQDVMLSSGRRGAVILETDACSEVGEVSADAGLDLTVLLTLFVSVLVAVNWILSRALSSFESLGLAFERIGRGDYEARVVENGPPEFARLAKTCNDMADQLGHIDGQARRLRLQLSTVQEEERSDLARNLHDEISPFLFAVDVDASVIRTLAGELPEPQGDAIRARATAIREATAHMKGEVRLLLGRLRPETKPDLGLADTIEDFVARARVRHPQAVIRCTVNAGTLDAATETDIHHVVREALSNALQHGNPRNVDIAIAEEPARVVICVCDDGRGFGANGGLPGFGIRGMRERVEARGGRFSLTPGSAGAGLIVEAVFPRVLASDDSGTHPVRAVEAIA